MEKRAPLDERVIVLPLEGKGDRSAVDEVTCGPAPLREAFAPMEKQPEMGSGALDRAVSLQFERYYVLPIEVKA